VEGAGGKKVIGVQWTVKRGNGMRICGVDGCDEKYLALGFCKKHYSKFKKETEHRICQINGCERPVEARGYCQWHYRDLIETRTIPLIYKRQLLTCSVDGCLNETVAHGLCTKHWKRWKKYGDPLALKKASWTESPKICKYPGCDRRVHAHFSCRKHTYYYAKIEVIEHYGGKCSCCGENRIEFLCLDHMNNDGHMHKVNGRRLGGYNLYARLLRENFSTDFELQVLCHNCNAAKAGYGYCPHKNFEDGQ